MERMRRRAIKVHCVKVLVGVDIELGGDTVPGGRFFGYGH